MPRHALRTGSAFLGTDAGARCRRFPDSAEDEDDAQGVLQVASLSGTVATGERAGKRVRKVVVLGGKEFALGSRCAGFDGYNLHANVAFAASDRGGLERLCRYVLRPPLAVGRLERLDAGRVRMGMKRVWSDGTSAIALSPLELCPPDRAQARGGRPPAAGEPGAVRGGARGERGVASSRPGRRWCRRCRRPARRNVRPARRCGW